MYKLLLAEHSDVVIKEITEMLDDRWDVRICRDGNLVKQMLDEFSPDVLIIDVYLPGKTAVSVLSDCFPDLPFLIIALGSQVNPFLRLHLSRWGVDFVIDAPFRKGLLSKVIKTPEIFHKIAVKRTMEHLRVLGVRAELNGYYYLLLGIPYKSEDPTRQLHGEVYAHIASVAKVDEESIERAIRKAIESAWGNRSYEIWCKYFPVDANGILNYPSNKEFVSVLAQKII